MGAAQGPGSDRALGIVVRRLRVGPSPQVSRSTRPGPHPCGAAPLDIGPARDLRRGLNTYLNDRAVCQGSQAEKGGLT